MDNRTIEEVRENETKLIDEIKQLEWENQLLRNQLEVGKEQYNNLVEEKEELKSLYDSTILEKQKCKEVIDKLKNKLMEYFEVGKDCYFYVLTRDKSAFYYGTMSFDDFKEFSEEQVDDIIDFLKEVDK